MREGGVPALVLLLTIALAGCAPPPRADQSGQPSQASSQGASRTLTMGVRYEVTELSPKRVAGGPSQYTKRSFNAALAVVDGAGAGGGFRGEGNAPAPGFGPGPAPRPA